MLLNLSTLDAETRAQAAAIIVCREPSGLGARLVTDGVEIDGLIGQPGCYIGVDAEMLAEAGVWKMQREAAFIDWEAGGESGPERTTVGDYLRGSAG